MKSVNNHRLIAAALLASFGASLSLGDEITLKPKVAGSVVLRTGKHLNQKGVSGSYQIGVRLGVRSPELGIVRETAVSVVEFDLSVLPKGTEIQGVRLEVKRVTTRETCSLSIKGYTGDGKLTSSDDGGSNLGTVTSPIRVTCAISVTGFVFDLAKSNSRYVGFSIADLTSTLLANRAFDTLSSDRDSSPSLIITYKVNP